MRHGCAALALYVLWRLMCWAFGRGVSGPAAWLVVGVVQLAASPQDWENRPIARWVVRERGRCAAADYTMSPAPAGDKKPALHMYICSTPGVRDEPAARGAGGAEHHGVARTWCAHLAGDRSTARSVTCRRVVCTPLVPLSPDMLCGPQTGI